MSLASLSDDGGSNTAVPGTFDPAGWLAGVRRLPSPNCDERPAGAAIELAVVHAISLPPDEFGGDGIERLFTNCLDPCAHPYFATLHTLRVSCHFLIRRGGELVQFVPCGSRAWHAGASAWRGRGCCNDFSVGIELEGGDSLPFEPVQYGVLVDLLGRLRACYPVAAVTGHCDIAPGRKSDPGPFFDWGRLNRLLTTASS